MRIFSANGFKRLREAVQPARSRLEHEIRFATWKAGPRTTRETSWSRTPTMLFEAPPRIEGEELARQIGTAQGFSEASVAGRPGARRAAMGMRARFGATPVFTAVAL